MGQKTQLSLNAKFCDQSLQSIPAVNHNRMALQ